MKIAKIIKVRGKQAVLLPKEFQFSEAQVWINRMGPMVVLFPESKRLDILKESLEKFTPDFMADGRRQPKRAERRKGL